MFEDETFPDWNLGWDPWMARSYFVDTFVLPGMVSLSMVLFLAIGLDNRWRVAQGHRASVLPWCTLLIFTGPFGVWSLGMATLLIMGFNQNNRGLETGFHSITWSSFSWVYHWFEKTFRRTEALEIPWDRKLQTLKMMEQFNDSDAKQFSARREGLGVRNLIVVVFAIACVMATVVNGGLAIIATATITYVLYTIERGTWEQFDTLDNAILSTPRRPLGDVGIYELRTKSWFGTEIGRGIVWEGTLHTRYHVTNGSPVVVNGEWHYPTSVSREADLITYFGLSRMRKMRPGDQLFVNLVDVHWGHNCVGAMPCFDGEIAYVQVPGTVPGTSGSPIFRLKDNLEEEDLPDEDDDDAGEQRFVPRKQLGLAYYELVGLTGHFLATSMARSIIGRVQAEIQDTRAIPEPRGEIHSAMRGVIQIFDYPGFGKTRVRIPEIIRSMHGTGKTIIIAEPTRGMCKDVSEFLASGDAGRKYNIRDMSHGGARGSSAHAIVAPHQVVFEWALRARPLLMQGNVILIIDEAHNHQRESIALVEWARKEAMASDRLVSVELTATGYDILKKKYVISDGSRFPIKDLLIEEADMIPTIMKECFGTQRMVVFLPSIRGKTQSITSMAKALKAALVTHGKKAQIVEFSRDSFTYAWPKIKKTYPVPLIILATNIAEMGLNMNVDVVVDSSKQVVFTECEPRYVIGKVDLASEAQRVQRRGRVGRRKEGVYYEVKMPGKRAIMYPENSIDAKEGHMLVGHLKTKRKDADIPDPLWPAWMVEAYYNRNISHQFKSFETFRRKHAENTTRSDDAIVEQLEIENRVGEIIVDRNRKIYRVAFYDDRDSKWYEKMWAKMDHFINPHDGRPIPEEEHEEREIEEEQAPADEAICTLNKDPDELTVELDHDERAFGDGEQRIRHQHRCPNCAHIWRHRHNKREKDEQHVNGLLCPCCTGGVFAALKPFGNFLWRKNDEKPP